MTRTAISPRFAIRIFVSTPDTLARMGEVDGTGRGRFAEVRRVAETGSTNRDLLEAAADGAPDRTVLVAAHQTAGRGRRDRTWSAPPGASLLVSVLLRPTLSPERLFLLTMACGLAAVEAADQVAGVRLGLKWPNDLVAVAAPGLDPAAVDRKAGGILAESLVVDDRVEAVVVGMGLNVDWPFPLAEDLAAIATSLDRLAGAPVDLEAVLASWLDRYGALLDDLEDGDGSGVLERARSVSATVGRTVEVVLADRTFRGRASAIADSGHLLVDHDGVTEDVAVGDVVHARLAD
jgi:BirA family biotin operon repressor/biotin-[acetyl-CoA-carboxylase] ligase